MGKGNATEKSVAVEMAGGSTQNSMPSADGSSPTRVADGGDARGHVPERRSNSTSEDPSPRRQQWRWLRNRRYDAANHAVIQVRNTSMRSPHMSLGRWRGVNTPPGAKKDHFSRPCPRPCPPARLLTAKPSVGQVAGHSGMFHRLSESVLVKQGTAGEAAAYAGIAGTSLENFVPKCLHSVCQVHCRQATALRAGRRTPSTVHDRVTLHCPVYILRWSSDSRVTCSSCTLRI